MGYDPNYKYNQFMWTDPEKLKIGPIPDEERRCHDLCCIIFLYYFYQDS